jgi:hypothetical protein
LSDFWLARSFGFIRAELTDMVADFIAWWKNPLGSDSGQPSAVRLFLFIGLILVLLAAWGLIFRHIREAV